MVADVVPRSEVFVFAQHALIMINICMTCSPDIFQFDGIKIIWHKDLSPNATIFVLFQMFPQEIAAQL